MSDDQMLDQIQNGAQDRQHNLAARRIHSGGLQNILRRGDLRPNAALLQAAKNEKRRRSISVDLVLV